MEKIFTIGTIVNTQGIKGDVRIIPMTDDIKRFELLKSVMIINNNDKKELNIEKVWYHKKFVILKFKGIDDMSSAEKLKNYRLQITEKEVLPLNENEYYIGDLYGMNVYTEENEFLGDIVDIIFTGANDVYVVKSEDKKELLIPAIKQCIINVDLINKKMIVHLLEGLR